MNALSIDEMPCRELKIIYDNLTKTGCGVKKIIKFSVPMTRAVMVAEAEVRAEFYPGGFDPEFIKLLNGVDFSCSTAGFIKKTASRHYVYCIFKLARGFYALAFDETESAMKLRYNEIELALKLCEGFCHERALSDIEPMTSLYNHGYFQRELRRFILRSVKEWGLIRYNDPPIEYDPGAAGAALILFDIDNFKAFNDTYGHHTGDAVIKAVAEASLAVVSRYGRRAFAARYGGEEFVAALSGVARSEAIALAEDIRAAVESIDGRAIAKAAGTALKIGRVTVSVGAAFYDAAPVNFMTPSFTANTLTDGSSSSFISTREVVNERGDSKPRGRIAMENPPENFDIIDIGARELIRKADMALYASKRFGKNRVTQYGSLTFSCVRVIERRGGVILINGGSAHGIGYDSRFEVYDARYDGSSEIYDPDTSKKIGNFPRLFKGVISVSKRFDIFDSVLMEKIAVCGVEKESSDVSIGAGDICVPAGVAEKELYSSDIFAPRELPAVQYYQAPASSRELENFSSLVLFNLHDVLKRTLCTGTVKFSSLINELRAAARTHGLEYDEWRMLSSDKALACFKKKFRPSSAHKLAKTFNERLAAVFGDVPPVIRISFLNSGHFVEAGALRSDPLRFLRIADFVNGFYVNPSFVEEFDYQSYRKYGLYKYYCAEYETALELFNDCIRLFKQPPDFRLYQNIGGLALKLNKTGMALKYLSMAEKLDDSSVVPKANLALIYSLNGAFDRAVEYYEKCLAAAPLEPQYNNNMAHNLLASGGCLKYALKCSLTAVKYCPPVSGRYPAFLDTLGDIYMRLGDYRRAVITYKKEICAYNLDAPPAVYIKLARAFYESGDCRLAAAAAEAVKMREGAALNSADTAECEFLAACVLCGGKVKAGKIKKRSAGNRV